MINDRLKTSEIELVPFDFILGDKLLSAIDIRILHLDNGLLLAPEPALPFGPSLEAPDHNLGNRINIDPLQSFGHSFQVGGPVPSLDQRLHSLEKAIATVLLLIHQVYQRAVFSFDSVHCYREFFALAQDTLANSVCPKEKGRTLGGLLGMLRQIGLQLSQQLLLLRDISVQS
jgi:hypothetical protein